MQYKIGEKFYDLINASFQWKQNVPLNMALKEVNALITIRVYKTRTQYYYQTVHP